MLKKQFPISTLEDARALRRAIVIAASALVILVAIIHTHAPFILPSELSIEVKGQAGDVYQVFYDRGRGYNEEDSVRSPLSRDGAFETLRFRFPGVKIEKIRIDPGTKPGNVLIGKICVGSFLKKHCWTAQDLCRECAPLHDITGFETKDNLLSITSSGNDPYFAFKGDFSGEQFEVWKVFIYPAAFLLCFALFFLLYRHSIITGAIDATRPALLQLIRYRYAVAAVLFVVLVAAKLHGSSLAMWDHYIKVEVAPSAKTLLFGEARGIRSDEWLVQTPMYLSQAESKSFFPLMNLAIRSDGQNMLVSYYAPVFDITLIGKPFNWGFFFLGKERGLSWYWWSKLLLLLLLSYEMCLLLTDEKKLISALGALWITFSPFIQWWFSTQQVDLVIYAQALVVAACRYLTTEGRRRRLFLAAALTVSSVGFILSFYPPFQVSLGYLVLLFVAVYAYGNRSSIKLGKYDLVLLFVSFVVMGAVLFSFVARSMDAVRLVMDTVYPGRRLATGGGYNLNDLQFYLSNWRLPFKEVTFSNRCEVSSFLHFLPAILFVFFKVYRKETAAVSRSLGFALLCYLLFQVSWLFVQYPEWFARWTFLSRVPEGRMQAVMGLVAVYLSIWMFSLLVGSKTVRLSEALITSLFVVLLYIHSLKHTFMLDYLKPTGAAPTLIFFFVLNCLFLLGRKRLFAVSMILFIVFAGMTVNPLARGVDPIYNKVIGQKILEIARRDTNQKWIGVNSLVLGNYMVALGIKTFNSVHYYPDLNAWRALDPEGRYKDVYNRYAHVMVQLTDEDTYFKLEQGDVFTVFINGGDLRKTDSRYLVSNGRITGHTQFLREVDRVGGDNLYIYEIK